MIRGSAACTLSVPSAADETQQFLMVRLVGVSVHFSKFAFAGFVQMILRPVEDAITFGGAA